MLFCISFIFNLTLAVLTLSIDVGNILLVERLYSGDEHVSPFVTSVNRCMLLQHSGSLTMTRAQSRLVSFRSRILSGFADEETYQ